MLKMKKQNSERVGNFNLPNALTIFRILFTPLCVFFLFKGSDQVFLWKWLAWSGFFTIGLTDLIDGRLARSKGIVTDFGALLDPIADKISIGAALISLSLLHKIWWWVTALILFREIGVTILRFLVLKNGVIPASKGGKLKTLTQGFAIGFYIMPLYHFLIWPRDILMALAILLTIWTGFDYLFKIFIAKSQKEFLE
jgi:CDP-diacylglycerol---glycerol-3-phosphate 3-phosphatidyltransferase